MFGPKTNQGFAKVEYLPASFRTVLKRGLQAGVAEVHFTCCNGTKDCDIELGSWKFALCTALVLEIATFELGLRKFTCV